MSVYYSDSCTDYADNILVVEWSQQVWEGHLKKHPQLIDMKNASSMIHSAVGDPSVVMEGTLPGGGSELIVIYYREVRSHQIFVTYIKVVSGVDGNRRYIKTVFEERAPADLVIQEKKYPKDFKEIWRTSNKITIL